MRFSAALTCLVACAAPITAAALNGRSGVKAADDDDHKVPGESPLQLCPGEHDKDLIEIESVDLTPNPPKAYGGPFVLMMSNRADLCIVAMNSWLKPPASLKSGSKKALTFSLLSSMDSFGC